MAWVAVDDRFADQPKMLAVGPLAWALWLAGLAYCNSMRTDGFIPDPQIPLLVNFDGYSMRGEAADSCKLAKRLIDVGIWQRSKEDGVSGVRVSDYFCLQRSKAQIEADIEKKRKAGKLGAESRWGKRGAPADSNGHDSDSGGAMARRMAGAKGSVKQ